MKNPKKLTRAQKYILTRNDLDATQYSLISEDDETLILFNKLDKSTVTIPKKKKKRK